MKRIIMNAMMTACGIIQIVSADSTNLEVQSQDVDGVTWYYCVENDAARIGGYSGGYAFSAVDTYEVSGALSIPAKLGDYPVTQIGDYAFEFCEGMTSISIPSTVTHIGHAAFYGCYLLQTVTGGSGVKSVGSDAFYETPFVTEAADGPVTIGNAWVAYVGEVPETLVIPDNIESIGFDINNVKDLTVSRSFQPGYLSFCAKTLRIPSVDYWLHHGGTFNFAYDEGNLGFNLYVKDTPVTTVTIPGTAAKVSESLFAYCLSLTSATILEGVTTIDHYAFEGCSNLTHVELPQSVKKIGRWAFYNCSKLDLDLPAALLGLGEEALYGTLSYKDALKSANGGVVYLDNWCLGFDRDGGKCPSTITIKDGTRGIAYGAFADTGLTKVAFPDSIVAIDDCAFAGTALTSVTLPPRLKRLGKFSFAGSKLTAIPSIPQTLEQMGYGVFNEYDGGVTPAYAKLPTGWIARDGWLLEYKAFEYHYDAAEGGWYADDEESVACPQKLVVPTGIKHIADSVCGRIWDRFTDLVLPIGLETIGENAFNGADLGEVTIPATVKRIGDGAFLNADGPVTFLGLPPEVNMNGDDTEIDECPFRDASIGYFIAGTSGWTNGMTFAGLTMIARDDLGSPVTPEPEPEIIMQTVILSVKSEIDTGLTGYTVAGLPKGLAYASKTGKITGTCKTATGDEGVTVTFKKSGEDDVAMKFIVREENTPTVACEGLDGTTLLLGVTGSSAGIPLDIDAESGIKSVTATKLPTGMKLASSKDKKSWYITGAPTKVGTYAVTIALTTAAGTKVTKDLTVAVDALPGGVTGTFNGFVVSEGGHARRVTVPSDVAGLTSAETSNVGSLQVTVSDVGKITAKVVAAAGTYSFAATSWDSVTGSVYYTTMMTKKGDVLSLACDSDATWNAHQLTGAFTSGTSGVLGERPLQVEAQKNAFGKQWFFDASGNEADGWTLSFAENAKSCALSVTLNADGKTSVAGKLSAYKITAAGYADMSGLGAGAIFADFAPIVTVGKTKKVLSLRTNLWFDKKSDHAEGVGSAVFAQ